MADDSSLPSTSSKRTADQDSSLYSGGSKRKKNPNFCGPKDPLFRINILHYVGVQIGKPRHMVYDGRDILNNEDSTGITTRIFLDIKKQDAGQIVKSMKQILRAEYDEDNFRSFFQSQLGPVEWVLDVEDEATVTTSFCLRSFLYARRIIPSAINNKGKVYEWKLKPDLVYMSSINAFPCLERGKLVTNCCAFLADDYGFAPYLTVEYKVMSKSGKESDAENQNATNSYLQIYQRQKLRLALKDGKIDEELVNLLRHYSLIIQPGKFSVWLTSCNIDTEEYYMRKIVEGNFDEAGLKIWAKWWNAINRWGLGTYAQSFKKDLEEFAREQEVKKAEIRRQRNLKEEVFAKVPFLLGS